MVKLVKLNFETIDLKKVIVLIRHSRDRFMLKLNNCIHSMSFYFFCVKCQLYFHTIKFIYLRNGHIIDKKKLNLIAKN